MEGTSKQRPEKKLCSPDRNEVEKQWIYTASTVPFYSLPILLSVTQNVAGVGDFEKYEQLAWWYNEG